MGQEIEFRETMHFGCRRTPRSELVVKLPGSLRLTGHYYERQTEVFVESCDQSGFGGIEYDCLVLPFDCGQAICQFLVRGQIPKQR